MQICYDTHFPEATTAQALAGAEMIFMPHSSSALPTGAETREEKRTRWLRYLPARAYDNSVFVVVVNQIDKERGIPGIAMALDPWGKLLAEARPDSEDLLVANFKRATLEGAARSR